MPEAASMPGAAAEAAPRYLKLGLAVALLAIVLDQLSKWLIVTRVMTPPRVIEVTGFFKIVLAWNTGVSFSMLDMGGAFGRWGLAVLALIIVIVLFFWLRKTRRRLPAIGLGLVIGGALGNVIDRVRVGAVADFLLFHWRDLYWPAFNVADCAITLGVAALLVDALFGSRESHKTHVNRSSMS
jgi:signal peptidase II